jgi:hypothetical protein
VINILNRDIILIQNLSDIGKSYIDIVIIKILLKNRKIANLDPIIYVCYTNYALDQLLKYLIKDRVEQMIRINSRSKFQLLQNKFLLYFPVNRADENRKLLEMIILSRIEYRPNRN